MKEVDADVAAHLMLAALMSSLMEPRLPDQEDLDTLSSPRACQLWAQT